MIKEKNNVELARLACVGTSNRGKCENCGFYKKDCYFYGIARRVYDVGFRRENFVNEIIYELTTDFDGVDCQIKRGVIVRCRDCKKTRHDETGSIYCEEWDQWEMPGDGYCFKGKHRE